MGGQSVWIVHCLGHQKPWACSTSGLSWYDSCPCWPSWKRYGKYLITKKMKEIWDMKICQKCRITITISLIVLKVDVLPLWVYFYLIMLPLAWPFPWETSTNICKEQHLSCYTTYRWKKITMADKHRNFPLEVTFKCQPHHIITQVFGLKSVPPWPEVRRL